MGQKQVGSLSTYQRSDVTLDTTRSDTDDDDGYNEASQTGPMCQGRGDRSANQDQKTDEIDDTEDHDGLVLSQVLVRNNSTENRSN